ncbi:ABC transporter permease [Streptomyces sp. DH12]|uniref:ABC transporter permease n=1 Tax=Streptomyces sp. DH12 TaxID=2857010 RepID=UPI001E2EE42B|nr:ABC transporter permease [Streptomyces sp. DH12]
MSATPQRRMTAAMVLVPVFAALAVWAFVWPAARVAPRDLPVGLAGPESAVTQLEKGFRQAGGGFELHRYADADADAARSAIEDRSVYGAVVAGPAGPEVLVASAAGPAVAQLLQQAAAAQSPDGRVKVTDVVPSPSGDPRGSGMIASILPLALAGLAAGAVVTLLGLRGRRGAVALVGASALVGLVAAAITDTWLGTVDGPWLAEAGVIGLTVLATGAAVAGFAALIGPPGIGIGAVLMVLLGNPFSGVTSAPEMLPEPVGTLGQLLPPGAGASLLRSVAFFDGAGAAAPLATLVVWALLGLALVFLGARRAPAGRPAPGTPTQEPAPVG